MLGEILTFSALEVLVILNGLKYLFYSLGLRL